MKGGFSRIQWGWLGGISGLYLRIFYSLRVCCGTPVYCIIAGWHTLDLISRWRLDLMDNERGRMEDDWGLEVVMASWKEQPDPTEDARPYSGLQVAAGTHRWRPSTYGMAFISEDGRHAPPSLLTPPGTDGIIRRPGRLGTLVYFHLSIYRIRTEVDVSVSCVWSPDFFYFLFFSCPLSHSPHPEPLSLSLLFHFSCEGDPWTKVISQYQAYNSN